MRTVLAVPFFPGMDRARRGRCFGFPPARVRLGSGLGRFLPLLALLLPLACGDDPVHPPLTAEFIPGSLTFPITALGDTARLRVELASFADGNQRIGLGILGEDYSIEPGCGPFWDGPPDSTTAVERISWGAIKARYGASDAR